MAIAAEPREGGIDYLLGVDGGGTATRAVLAATGGVVIGRGQAGPSALGQGIAQAWRHVCEARDPAAAAQGPAEGALMLIRRVVRAEMGVPA